MCNVRGAAHSNETTEPSPDTAVLHSTTEHFRFFKAFSFGSFSL